MTIIEKDISQIAVGSYIVEIVQQTGNVNLKKSGWVRDFAAIENLIHEGVKRVKIDTSKKFEEEKDNSAQTVSNELPTNQEKNGSKITNKGNQRIKADFGERLETAKKVFDEAKSIQAGVLEEITKNRPIDIGSVNDFVDNSIELVFDNPDALTCVLNIRNKDEYLLEHSVSVSILISVFAVNLGFDKGTVKQLAIGAFLHDVGKIKVRSEVLNKPAKLTDEEFEEIKMHATYSKEIVDGTAGLSELSRQIVANHHEKLNGGGYPRGISESHLSQYDRMIAICDIFDALSANRVYKEGIPLVRAFAILRELASTNHLDGVLVDRFIHCMGVYPVGSLVQLKSKRLAIVEERNDESPTRPLVTAFFNLGRNAFTETRKIDLAKNTNESIEKAVRPDDFGLDMSKVSEFLMMQG